MDIGSQTKVKVVSTQMRHSLPQPTAAPVAVAIMLAMCVQHKAPTAESRSPWLRGGFGFAP